MSSTAPPPSRQRRLLALLLALVPLLSAACKSDEPPEPDPEQVLSMHVELALRYYDLDDLLRAEQQARSGLEIDPENRILRLLLGWIRQRRGEREDILVAERVFRALLEEDVEEEVVDYRVTLGLAEALERKGLLFIEAADGVRDGSRDTIAADREVRASELARQSHEAWKESLTFYQQTLEAKPRDIQAINGMLRVTGLFGRDRESLAWSDELLEISSSELVFWRRQLEREDLTAAEENRLRNLQSSAIELQIETQLHTANLLRRLGRTEESVERLNAVLELDPTMPLAYSLRAQQLQSLGRFEEAIASIDQFLRLSDLDFDHPDVRRAYSMRASCEAALRVLQPSAR